MCSPICSGIKEQSGAYIAEQGAFTPEKVDFGRRVVVEDLFVEHKIGGIMKVVLYYCRNEFVAAYIIFSVLCGWDKHVVGVDYAHWAFGVVGVGKIVQHEWVHYSGVILVAFCAVGGAVGIASRSEVHDPERLVVAAFGGIVGSCLSRAVVQQGCAVAFFGIEICFGILCIVAVART